MTATSKDFTVLNKNNNPIECTLRYGTIPNKLVLICVGFGDKKDLPVYQKIADLTRSAGFSVLSFNYSKDGEYSNIHGQFSDTAQLISEFSKDYPDISIIGGSLGAIPTLLSALNLEEVKRVAIVNGFFGRSDIEPKFRRKYNLIKFLSFFNKKYAKIISLVKKATMGSNFTKPILFVHGEDDKVVNPDQSKYFHEKVNSKEKKLIFVKNADHGLSRAGNVEDAVNEITDWFLSF